MTDQAKNSQELDGAREVQRSKFDLGAPSPLTAPVVPWGYGESRVRAMVRSPDSLYLYWEITDDDLARARVRLGPAGQHAWCNLRLYDTTGRDFDGTNANDYFDIHVERTDREYFLELGRPGRVVHAEIGMRSHEGFFQPIARSGRAEFPRKSPSPHHALEWMTVTGGGDCPAARPFESRYGGPEPPLPGAQGVPSPQGPAHDARAEERSWTHEEQVSREWHFEEQLPWLLEHWRTEWQSELQLRWVGPFNPSDWLPLLDEALTWRGGPFPLELPTDRVSVEWNGGGPFLVHGPGGPVQVYGPWRVTIRGFASQPQRQVIGTWAMHVVQVSPVVHERSITGLERKRVGAWARERVMVGASEAYRLLEIGASEVWRIGASERLWIGASGWLHLGASAWLARGASELYAIGASRGWSAFLGGSERVAASWGRS